MTTPEERPDPRFSLANERTFLAYVRTALAVLAGGIATLGYVPDAQVALAAGVGLIAVGFVALIGGYLRWRHVNRAMAAGRPIAVTPLPMVITVVLAATVVAALVATLTAR